MRIRLDCPLSLCEIKYALSLKSVINPTDNSTIQFISTDTRELSSGDLFLALHGENYNGENFVFEAKNKGAYTVSAFHKDADFFVENTLSALSVLANYYKKRLLNLKSTIAITGSVGKTTTKDLISTILSKKYKTHSTYKNLNNEIGVPLTVLSAEADTEILVIEAGMNHLGEVARLSLCLEPDISVITKIGTSHIGNLGSRENIAKAKSEIITGMKKPFALVPYGENLLSNLNFAKTVSAYDRKADFSLLKNEESGFFDFHSSIADIYNLNIKSKLSHIPHCLSFAITVALILDMTPKEIFAVVSDLNLDSMQKICKIGELTVIDDSYNSSAESVEMALKTLSMTEYGEKSAVLGDMLELGDLSESLHKKIGEMAAKANLSKLYIIGKYAKFIKTGAVEHGFSEDRIFINESPDLPEITADQIMQNSTSDTILLKASRRLKLERITDILKEKIQRGNNDG